MTEISGTIVEIFPEKTSASGYVSQEFVLKTQGEYPQFLLLQSDNKNKFNDVKNEKVGNIVNVKINLRGRAWTSPQGEVKYFNTLFAWSIWGGQEDSKEQAKTEENVQPLLSKNSQSLEENLGLEVDSDDLPF